MAEGFIAVVEAINGFDLRSNLTFSSYFWWHLQKRFHSVLGTDKVVEVKHIDGREETISYREFLRIKRSLPEGTEWRTTSLLSSFDEVVGKINYGPVGGINGERAED
jgi:hypothetical protein